MKWCRVTLGGINSFLIKIMNKNIIIGVVIVVALGLGYYLYSPVRLTNPQIQPVETILTPVVTQQVPSAIPGIPKTVIVKYTSTGFSPNSVTIARGDTVTFIADSNSDEMWVASGVHPTHEKYDGTTKDQHCVAGYTGSKPFDQCSAGASYSFTFEKVVTQKYHNHGNAGDTGVVIVQ